MQDIQLYIEGQRVEMFEDESITLPPNGLINHKYDTWSTRAV